jgi:hypothetical protein
LPRCSCPYAGTTRIRFEGLPRPIFSGRRRLSPLSGHPLDAAIIRKLSPVRRFDDGGSRAAGRPATRNAALLMQNFVKYD